MNTPEDIRAALKQPKRPVELSDRAVDPEDIVACPDACALTSMHRHLRGGMIQVARRGFGVLPSGEVVLGPEIPS